MYPLSKISFYFSGLMVFLLVSQISCNKGKLIDSYLLTDEMLDQIPYKGGESISYKTIDNTILTFDGSPRTDTLIKGTACINCDDYYIYQHSYIEFTNNNTVLGIKLIGYNQLLYIYMLYNDINYSAGFPDNLPLSKEKLINDQFYLDSLQIGNQVYYELFGNYFTSYETTNDTIRPLRFYYSVQKGIVKIDFTDDSYMTLVN